MKDYTLAVIIPCWNCEPYIGAMLDCLIGQTFTDWKVFLIDDGCTDGTGEIIKAYAIKDKRINYYKRDREPKGAPTCRNIGFNMTEGAKYVIFLDADDLIAPFCFEQRVRMMDNAVDVDFLSFPSKAFQEDPYDKLRWGFGVKGCQETLLSLLNWRTLSIVVCTNIFKRDSLIEKGLVWDERLLSMQDSDFNIQALCKGLRHEFASDTKIDYFYRHLPDSVSKKVFKKEHYESHVYLIDKEVTSIRNAFGNKYDFFLKSYIVVFFELFKKDKWPYKQLLKQSFVKRNPGFYLRLLLFVMFGLRGKNRLFRPYCQHNEKSIEDWRVCLASKLNTLLMQQKPL